MVPVVLAALPAILAALLVVVILVLVVILVRKELRRKRQPHQDSVVEAEPVVSVAAPPIPPVAPVPVSPIVSAPSAGAYLQLATVAGQTPQRFALTAAVVTIGRDPTCTIPVAEGLAAVSRRHAQIERDGDDYILTDLGSENGVFVNGVRIGRNLLRDGAVISLAQAVSFTFHIDHRSQL